MSVLKVNVKIGRKTRRNGSKTSQNSTKDKTALKDETGKRQNRPPRTREKALEQGLQPSNEGRAQTASAQLLFLTFRKIVTDV